MPAPFELDGASVRLGLLAEYLSDRVFECLVCKVAGDRWADFVQRLLQHFLSGSSFSHSFSPSFSSSSRLGLLLSSTMARAPRLLAQAAEKLSFARRRLTKAI